MTADETPDGDLGSICIGCGLCCDGTVVTHLAIRDESDLGLPLRALGVEVLVAAEPPVFALPCPALSAGMCTIHDLHRPRACHEFECAVSIAVADMSMTRSEATAIIGATFAMRAGARSGAITMAEFEDHLDRVFRVQVE